MARHNGDGTLLWVKRAGGSQEDLTRGLAAFPDGSCVVTGEFTGNMVFGPGEPGQVTLSSPFRAVFVARYRPDGTLAWARQGRGDRGTGAAALPDGSAVVVGDYFESDNFELAGVRAPRRPDPFLEDSQVFVGVFTPAGTVSHLGVIVGEGGVNAQRVAAFDDMTCIVSGSFIFEGIFGYETPQETTLTRPPPELLFFARYSVQ